MILEASYGTYTLVSAFLQMLQAYNKFSFWNHIQLLHCAIYNYIHIKILPSKILTSVKITVRWNHIWWAGMLFVLH